MPAKTPRGDPAADAGRPVPVSEGFRQVRVGPAAWPGDRGLAFGVLPAYSSSWSRSPDALSLYLVPMLYKAGAPPARHLYRVTCQYQAGASATAGESRSGAAVGEPHSGRLTWDGMSCLACPRNGRVRPLLAMPCRYRMLPARGRHLSPPSRGRRVGLSGAAPPCALARAGRLDTLMKPWRVKYTILIRGAFGRHRLVGRVFVEADDRPAGPCSQRPRGRLRRRQPSGPHRAAAHRGE